MTRINNYNLRVDRSMMVYRLANTREDYEEVIRLLEDQLADDLMTKEIPSNKALDNSEDLEYKEITFT